MTDSLFYYPMTLHRDTAIGAAVAPWTRALPLVQDVVEGVYVLTSGDPLRQGAYTWDGSRFRFTLPYDQICNAIIVGANIDVYYSLTTPGQVIPAGTKVWRNGLPYDGANFTLNDDAVWAVVLFSEVSQSDVTSVNGQTPDSSGNVTITTENIPNGTGQKLVDNDGSTTGRATIKSIAAGSGIGVLSTPVDLVISNLGVITVSSQSPDGDGNVVVRTTDNNPATGVSLISDSGSTTGNAKLKTLVQGNGITLASDANGNILINGVNQYTLPAATTTILGGVKVGSGLSATSDGTLSVTGQVKTVSGQAPDGNGNVVIRATSANSASGQTLVVNDGSTTGNVTLKNIVAGSNISLGSDANGNLVVNSTTAGSITAVNSEGTGVSIVDNDGTTGGVAILKSLAAGSNITITPAADGKTLTFAANQVLQPATTTTIGGVIVGTGLAVAGNGTLSLAAPSGVNIGGVKAGSGVSIASDGTISVTAVGGVSSVSGQTGTVVVSATNTSTASGTSLITGSGATTGTIVLRQLVAGSGIALATDANNNLQISSSGSSGVTSIAADSATPVSGAVKFTSGTSISLAQTGNTIQINGTGVPEAPNDSNVYGRGQGTWVVIPNASSAITSVTGQTGTNATLLVEANPPANSAIIKSLVAGTNVTLAESGGLITINAALPAGTVGSVNGILPNSSGNVTLTAANVAALPISGGTMTGAINMGSNALTGLINPVNDSDAVNYATLKATAIDGGVIG